MKYDVFISYSRKDYVDENKQVIPGNVISQIKDLFDSNGISYWFDEDGVFSGDAFAPVIARNIKESKIFLFISSENSNASEWTSNEIATAHAYKKKIIPFRYDESVYNDSVIIYIARLDYIEYHKNANKAFPRLLSSIQTFLKEEADKKEKERKEEERRRNDEISRQERAVKLQSLRERIETLENRKFDIEKEIITQEKSLTDLRNEKRIIEANIKDLQDEEQLVDEKKIINDNQEVAISENLKTLTIGDWLLAAVSVLVMPLIGLIAYIALKISNVKKKDLIIKKQTKLFLISFVLGFLLWFGIYVTALLYDL